MTKEKLFRSAHKSHATKFLITDDGKIRPPFVAITGLGETVAQELQRAGESGQTFISVHELAEACPKVSRTQFEHLKALSVLGDLPDVNQLTMFDY